MKTLVLGLLFMFLSLPLGAAPIISAIEGKDVLTQKDLHISFPTVPATTVLVFVSAKCPCSASHESLLKDLQSQFKDVQFIGIHSNADESAQDTKAHFSETHLPFPVLQDSHNQLANALGALKTPHAFVFSQKGELLYRGGVTDSHVGPTAKKHFLKEVLEDLQAGKPPRHKEGRALGCYIQREDE